MRIDKDELHNIFEGIAEKQEDKFNLLYEKYKLLVYSVAFSILKDRECSEDITQKVFLKIWKMERNKLPTCNEASWIYSLTKNESLNFLRTIKDEADLEDLYYIAEENTELGEIIDKDSYNRIIERLDREEQEIVSLKILANLSFRQISQILNIPMGTVQWRYYKSINTLKLLITNLSMFIITLGLFGVTRKVEHNQKLKSNEKIDLGETNENQKADSIKDEMTVGNLKNFNENNREFNETILVERNEITATTTDDRSGINKIEAGLIVSSLIFLIMSFVFLVVFRRQKKTKKDGK